MELRLNTKKSIAGASIAAATGVMLLFGCTSSSSKPSVAVLARPSERQLTIETAFPLVSDNDKFAVCRVRQLKAKENPYGRRGSLLTAVYLSDAEDADVLEFLAKHGYVRMQRLQRPTYHSHIPCPDAIARDIGPGGYYAGNGITCGDVPGGYAPSGAMWEPTPKAEAAMGRTIQQHQSAAPVELRRMLGIKHVISWDVILACRKLIGVDGLTPLIDSTRIDFSWKWMPTDLGRAARISDALERGEAYVRADGNGWKIENLYCKQSSN